MRLLPKPASGKELLVILDRPVACACNSPVVNKSEGKIPGRVYVDRNGKEWPWVCDQNPRMWLGQNEDED